MPRHHDADAVGTDDAQQMRLCRVECGLLQRAAPLTEFAETGGNDDGGARAALAPARRSEPGTVSGGVTMTARSGARGRLATFGWTASPSII